MVDKFIESLLGFITERVTANLMPRAKAVRALLDVHSALVDCHEAYLTWEQTNGKTLQGDAYNEWRRSVERLADAYQRVRHRLLIVSPEAAGHVHHYFLDEVSMSNSKTLNLLMKFTSEAPPDDIRSYASFDVAIEKLRSYIRTQYKWDDLFT